MTVRRFELSDDDSHELREAAPASLPLLWTPETRACVLARRSHGLRTPRPAGLPAIRSLYPKKRAAIARGQTFIDQDHAAVQRELLSFFDGAAPSISPRAAAGAALLFAATIADGALPDGSRFAPAMVSALLDLGGPVFLVAAATASASLSAYRDPVVKDALVLGPQATIRAHDRLYGPSPNERRFWGALRAALATAPDATYAEAREAAARELSAATPRVAAHLAFAFADEHAWAAAAAQRILAETGTDALLPMLLTAISDAALACSITTSGRISADDVATVACDVVDVLGPSAFGVLAPAADAALLGWSGETVLTLASALAVLPTLEAAEWLLDHVDHKQVRPLLPPFFAAAPRLAVAAIAPRAAARKASAAMTAILASAVRTHPDAAREEAARLDPRAAKIVGDAVAREDVEDAQPDELPAVLVTPPWASKKPRKKERETAEKALRFLASRGQRDVVVDVARRYGEACAPAIEDVLVSDGLEDGAPTRPPKLPDWFDPAALPRPRLRSGKALPAEAIRRLGEMLAFVDPDEPYVGIEHVRDACDPASLGAFAWALFQAWTLAGSPSAGKWAFFALAWFGTDDHAQALALIRAWPSEGAFGRAVLGLDVLGAMQSDVALMLVHGISQRAKSRPLLVRAKEKIASIAEALGLSPEELADRLVPDLGLDAAGTRTLDFGPRAFTVGFDEHLAPFVRDAEGARLKDLPKPGAKDDPELAAASSAEWKTLKKTARTVAQQQVTSFESAMIARRRWEAKAFVTYVVRHPLVGQLARRLVLGAFDDEGDLAGTFRVAEDGSYANADDESFTLPEGAKIGVIHPLEIDPALLATWGDRFADYEILQPFAQLARDVPRGATSADLEAPRFRSVDTLKLLALERRGWRRGPVGDGGVTGELEREIGPWRVTMILEPGIYAGDPTMNARQTAEDVVFSHASLGPSVAPDPIVLAEIVADLRGVGALGLR